MDHNPILQSIAQQVAPESNTPAGDPRLQFSIPCFEVDYEQSQAPSLRFIFFELPFPKPFPEEPFKMSFHVVNGWIGSSKPRQQQVKILKPDGSVFVETGRQPLEFENENTPFMAVNLFPDLPFDQTGLYQIAVHLEDKEVLRYPLTVRSAE